MAESSFHREAFISEDGNDGNRRLELLESLKIIFKCLLHDVVTEILTSILLGISRPSNTPNCNTYIGTVLQYM